MAFLAFTCLSRCCDVRPHNGIALAQSTELTGRSRIDAVRASSSLVRHSHTSVRLPKSGLRFLAALRQSRCHPEPNDRRRSIADDLFSGPMPAEPSQRVRVEYQAHLEQSGDTNFIHQPRMVGTTNEGRRMEGFRIRLAPGSEPINLQYSAHLQGRGDVGPRHLGEFIGTKGEGRRLEGFAIEVVGPAASQFDVYYQAHIQGQNDTGWNSNGEFCGSRGQSLRLEAMAVFIAEKRS
jgi:hypothetical protein